MVVSRRGSYKDRVRTAIAISRVGSRQEVGEQERTGITEVIRQRE